MKRLILALCVLLLASGCGDNVVGPPEPQATPAVNERQDPNRVPPVKALNHLAPEPIDEELGPVG